MKLRNPWKRYPGRVAVTVRVPGPVPDTVQELHYRGRPVREQGPWLVIADVVMPAAGEKGTDVVLAGEKFLQRSTIVDLQGPDA